MSKKFKSSMEELVVEIPQEAKPKIPFELWFNNKVRDGKLKDHQDYALMVFFEKRGLTELEEPDAYDTVLKFF